MNTKSVRSITSKRERSLGDRIDQLPGITVESCATTKTDGTHGKFDATLRLLFRAVRASWNKRKDRDNGSRNWSTQRNCRNRRPCRNRIAESRHEKRSIGVLEGAEQRKNATPTHAILPHSFFYPLFNSRLWSYRSRRCVSKTLGLPRRTFAEPRVKLVSTLRS